MVVMGIDPGLASTGWGTIEVKSSKLKVKSYGVIKTKPNLKFPERLKIIYANLNQLIQTYRPKTIAIEEIFFAKNVKTAISVGHCRGASILAAVGNNLPVAEYTPLEIKKALVGYGRADKNQVQQMLKRLLALNKIPKPDDAADALAVALCHIHTTSLGARS